MVEVSSLLPIHFLTVVIYFGAAIAISHFITKQIVSRLTFVSKIFAGSLFVAIYTLAQKQIVLALAATGPVGLLTLMTLNGFLYLFQLETILYPLLGAGLSWWLAVRLVTKRAQGATISSSVADPTTSTVPTPTTTSIKDLVMLLVALVLLIGTLYHPMKLIVTKSPIIPSVIRNPESCSGIASAPLQYNCVINSIPEGETVYDYCDYLPSGNNGGEATLTSSQCNLQRVLMLKDVQECKQLSGRRNANGNYYKCVANYPGTELHAQVCQELTRVEKLNFTYILNTKCLTKEVAQMKNEQGKTPLFYAETIELQNQLFEYGADPNARQTSGQPVLMTLLGWHPSYGDDPKLVLNLIENLLKNGADPNIVGEPPHKTPLEWVLYNYSTVETAELLVKYGADISQHCKGIDPERNDRAKYIASICPKE